MKIRRFDGWVAAEPWNTVKITFIGQCHTPLASKGVANTITTFVDHDLGVIVYE